MLAANNYLVDLDLGWNSLRAKGGIAIAEVTLSSYRRLPIPMLYVVWHTKGGVGGNRILRNMRAIVLQQCGQCRWGEATTG